MTALSASGAQVKAWDGPTRLFKWTFVALVIMAPTSKYLGDVTLAWHKMNGYAILTLILWRVMWGIAGSNTARFSTFVRWPWTAAGYALDLVRGRTRRFLGHNPLGGWMVVALLTLVALQGLTGLFVSDDIIVEGPLYPYGSVGLRRLAKVYHKTLFPFILLLAGVHILANVLYTFVKREPLIQAMVTGKKPEAPYEDSRTVEGGGAGLALALLLVAVAVVWGGVYLAGGTGAFR